MLWGRMLEELGVITAQELRVALNYKDENPEMTLGAVLLHLGYVTREKMENAIMNHGVLAQQNGRIDVDKVCELVDHLESRQTDLTDSLQFIAQTIENKR